MKIQVQTIHFDADQKLIDFVEKKVEKLSTFHDKIVSCEVFLKLNKDAQNENKIAEIKVNIPGNSLFTKENDKSFEAAVDQAVETLKGQLKKAKEKQLVH